MDIKGIRKRYNSPAEAIETVFLFLLFLYTCIGILNDSLLHLTFVVRFLNWGIPIVGVILFFYRNNGIPSAKKMGFALIVLVAFFTAAKATGRYYLVLYAAFIIMAEGANPDKTLKVWLTGAVLSLMTVLVLCKTGRLTDFIVYNDQKGAMHCLGFSYYSSFPFLLFYCSMAYIYVKKDDVHLYDYAFVGLVNLLIYQLTKLFLTYYLTVFFIVIDCLLVYIKKINLRKKPVMVISGLLFPLGAAATCFAMVQYNPEDANWVALDRVLHFRLSLMHQGFLRYPISLFGNRVEMTGYSALRTVTPEDYFYIDSGFAYSLLGYGLIFTVAAVALYSLLCVYSCRNNNKHLFTWLVCVAIFTMMNNVWIDVYWNPALLLSFAAYMEISELFPRRGASAKF